MRLPPFSRGRSSSNASRSSEKPIGILVVQALEAVGLPAADRNGLSDPFVKLRAGPHKAGSEVVKASLTPSWTNARLEIPVTPEFLIDQLIELVLWDRDTFTSNDYLGEISLSLDDCFPPPEGKNTPRPIGLKDPDNKPVWHVLESTRGKNKSRGRILVHAGFILDSPEQEQDLKDMVEKIIRDTRSRHLHKHSRILIAPPTQSVGTVPISDERPSVERQNTPSDSDSDHSFSSLEDDEECSDLSDEEFYSDTTESTPTAGKSLSPSATASTDTTPPQPELLAPPVSATTKKKRLQSMLRKGGQSTQYISQSIKKRTSRDLLSGTDASKSEDDSSSMPEGYDYSISKPRKTRRKRKARRRKDHTYSLVSQTGITGVCFIEIYKAADLPRQRNMTRTSFDMDPFVITSFGKKVFRTKVVRHSLNPVWDERLYFQVHQHEESFEIHWSIFDWDKLSANDYVGDAKIAMAELIEKAPTANPSTALYSTTPDGRIVGDEMRTFVLPLIPGSNTSATSTPSSPIEEKPSNNGSSRSDLESSTSSKHLGVPSSLQSLMQSSKVPTITVKAKFVPYAALRQMFWRALLVNFDTDDSMTVNRTELITMLDSLGSTLSRETIKSAFFDKCGKNDEIDELSFDELIRCLEEQTCKPDEQKRVPELQSYPDSTDRVPPLQKSSTGSFASTPLPLDDDSGLEITGHTTRDIESSDKKISSDQNMKLMLKEEPFDSDDLVGLNDRLERIDLSSVESDVDLPRLDTSMSASGDNSHDIIDESEERQEVFERVINVKRCPLCHKPPVKKKKRRAGAEIDIVTHMALCASKDWSSVGSFLVSNFVTSAQAHRKWVTKAFTKISQGSYQLGANSANIIVQDRRTGRVQEEKMQIYVRLGIRLLYKGMGSNRMEGNRIRLLLRSMSVKQGIKYDDPESAAEIYPFIAFHNLKMDEILDPLSSFKTFNEFFYRKLKPDARPVDDPNDPKTFVSCADCRMVAYQTVDEATKIWVKGREFTVKRLLGDQFGKDASRYDGGSLAVFRLAPQDYHRYHSPVDGTIQEWDEIEGEYYTVNPMAVRSHLDIFGENIRRILPVDSPEFGRVMNVCIGAMMVGSIRFTVEPGNLIKRGEEYGYFAFGGSTIVTLTPPNTVKFDEDIMTNSSKCIESLVRVGERIGRRI